MSASVVRRCGRALLLACSMAAVPLLQVRAQTSTGSIRGFVTSAAQAPVDNATVTARSKRRAPPDAVYSLLDEISR